MKALQERGHGAAVAHHEQIPIREYSNDPVQRERILRTRLFVEFALQELLREGIQEPKIIELGCGTGDVTGPYALVDNVVGVECSHVVVEHTRRRFPRMNVIEKAIEDFPPLPCSILVLSETLEHLHNPMELVTTWLPRARYAVISHPLDEDQVAEMNISAGDHQWSFSMEDFVNWFTVGQHVLVQHTVFKMGLYQIVLGLGKRRQ